MRHLTFIALLIALFSAQLSFSEEKIVFISGKNKTSIVELYTSQGCSSCPPADQWLAKFVTSDALWKEVIPIAYHVDYWDYLGWGDPFASDKNSQRQRMLKRRGNITAVYTPGIVVNGKEWRGWYKNKRALPKDTTAVGRLKVTLQNGRAYFEFADGLDGREAHAALLGFDFETSVKRGENADRTLYNHFVILNKKQKLFKKGDRQLALPKPLKFNANRLALVFWITERGVPAHLQATGGWIKRSNVF